MLRLPFPRAVISFLSVRGKDFDTLSEALSDDANVLSAFSRQQLEGEKAAGHYPIKRRIRVCDRCGGDHGEVYFLPFCAQRHPNQTHWAACPATGEPMIIEAEPEEVPRESCERVPGSLSAHIAGL